MTWKKIIITTNKNINTNLDDSKDLECSICEYQHHDSRKTVTGVLKESMPPLGAYDTEYHLHNLWGIEEGLNQHGTSFLSHHNPEEIRISSNHEAEDFLNFVKNQEWFKNAFHPVLTSFKFDVKQNSRIGGARFIHSHRPLSLRGLRDLGLYSDRTLFDPNSTEEVIHNAKCKRCKGAGFRCRTCGRPDPCKLWDHENYGSIECIGLLTQGSRIINPYLEGKIEYGNATGFTRNKITLLHELTHVINPYGISPAAAHGPEFLGAYGHILKRTMGDESYEAFRKGVREQVRIRSTAAFNSNQIDPQIAEDIEEDNAAIKGQRKILTPNREKIIQQQKERKKQRTRKIYPFVI